MIQVVNVLGNDIQSHGGLHMQYISLKDLNIICTDIYSENQAGPPRICSWLLVLPNVDPHLEFQAKWNGHSLTTTVVQEVEK